MLADIPTYSVLDFPLQILQSNENGVGTLQRDRHLGSLFIDELESVPIHSSGLFFIFIFPLIL